MFDLNDIRTAFLGLVVLLTIQVTLGQVTISINQKLHLERRLQHTLSGLLVFLFHHTQPRKVVDLFLIGALVFTLGAHLVRKYVPVAQRIFLASFERILRKPEAHGLKIPTAVYFLIGNLIAVYMYSHEFAGGVILAIAVGDPMAGIIGTCIPSRKLVKDKTLSGFLGCAVVSSIVFMLSTNVDESALAVLFGLSVALSETFAVVDDNICIPLICGPIFTLLTMQSARTPV
jgi:dolichol kinase